MNSELKEADLEKAQEILKRQLDLAKLEILRMKRKTELHMHAVGILTEEISKHNETRTKEDLKQLLHQTHTKIEDLRTREQQMETMIAEIPPGSARQDLTTKLEAIIQFQLNVVACSVTKLESKTAENENMRNGFNSGWKQALGLKRQGDFSELLQASEYSSENTVRQTPLWQQRVNEFMAQGRQNERTLNAELDENADKIKRLETILRTLKSMQFKEWTWETYAELLRKEEEVKYIKEISRVLEQRIAILNEAYRNLQSETSMWEIDRKIERAKKEEERLKEEYANIKSQLEKVSNNEAHTAKEGLVSVFKRVKSQMHDIEQCEHDDEHRGIFDDIQNTLRAYAPEHYQYESWTPKPASTCVIQ